jgi:hypothetical protein
MVSRRKRAEQRILVLDIETDAFIYVTRREANLYWRAYQRPPGAEIILIPSYPKPPWMRSSRGTA